MKIKNIWPPMQKYNQSIVSQGYIARKWDQAPLLKNCI